MKKLPISFKNLLPVIAIILLIASCKNGKEPDTPAGQNLGGPIDKVFDDVTKKERAYEAGEAIFYTMKIDSADVASLLADSSFHEITFAQSANSFRRPTSFQLKGFAANAAKLSIDSLPVNLQPDASRLPKVFADSSVLFGVFTISKSAIRGLITDSAGYSLRYTHIEFSPEMSGGSVSYQIYSYSGTNQVKAAIVIPSCCRQPSPPARPATCICPN